MNIIQKIFSGDELLQPFIKALDTANRFNKKICILEILNVLIKSCKHYFNNKTNVKAFVKKISKILIINSNNKQILLPTLGTILSLRDKNYDAFMEGLCNL